MFVPDEDDDFSELLRRVGWNNKELARRLGVQENTVSRWHYNGAPEYAMEHLRQADRLVGKE